MCVCLCLLHSGDTLLTYIVRTFLEREDILGCLHNVKGLFEGSDLVLRVGLELTVC